MQNRIHKKLYWDLISKFLVFLFACSCIAILILMFSVILQQAFPGFEKYGFWHMFFTADFSEAGGYGIWGPLSITLITSILAIIIAAPISFRVAVFIIYRQKKYKKITSSIVNIISGVPSVIFGVFAINSLYKFTNFFFNYSSGMTIINGVIMLAIMVIPTLTALLVNQLRHVPEDVLNASIALGNSKSYSIYKIVRRHINSGYWVAIVVALGRAIGETMALSMILPAGATGTMFPSMDFLGMQNATLGVMIARLMFTDSNDPTLRGALFAAGIALFIIVMILITIINRISKKRTMNISNPLHIYEKYPLNIYPPSFNRYLLLFFHYLFLPILLLFYYLKVLIHYLKQIINYILFWIMHPIYMLILPKFNKDQPNWKYYMKVSKSNPVKIGDYLRIAFELLSLLIVVSFLAWICFDIFSIGFARWNWDDWKFVKKEELLGVGTVETPGLLLNPLIFTMILIVLSLVITFPFALATAIYLSEYASNNRAGKIIRFFLDSLGSTPSILFGIFGMIFFINNLQIVRLGGSFSIIAGVLTMTLVILPTFTRTIEQVITNVPQELRHASYAIGASKFETIRKVVLPQAMSGIIAGTILSAGRIIGETAPVYLVIGMLGSNKIDLLSGGWTMTTKIFYNQVLATGNLSELTKQSYMIASVALVFITILILLAELVEPVMMLHRKRRSVKKYKRMLKVLNN